MGLWGYFDGFNHLAIWKLAREKERGVEQEQERERGEEENMTRHEYTCGPWIFCSNVRFVYVSSDNTSKYHCIRNHTDILIPTSAQTHLYARARPLAYNDDVKSRINDIKRKGCVTIDILRVQSHAICLYAALYIELESSGSLFRWTDCVCNVYITFIRLYGPFSEVA